MVHKATRKRISKEIMMEKLGFNDMQAEVKSVIVSHQKFMKVEDIEPYVLKNYT